MAVGRSCKGGARNVFTEKQDRRRHGGRIGIGLATAKRFVEEGAYVFIAGRRQIEFDKAVEEVGSNVAGVKTDISKLVEKTMTTAVTPEHFHNTFNTTGRRTP